MSKPTIMVVDGQGGGLGKAIIERLRKEALTVRILAVGTNSIAASVMLKAGADDVATGENAVVVNSSSADLITGGIGIISANAMLGEITPAMANAIAGARATKLLVPSSRCDLVVVGAGALTLAQRMEALAEQVRRMMPSL
ncbi:MAG: DUF3842 family protein [Verrucomicrobiales bacterium]|jgi:NAD(P)-dependent dehydrogenase (short-subunit alcohol dehydrogenase family)|nr:DUF3842 family protein [Verrucomicrobiales bacterium]